MLNSFLFHLLSSDFPAMNGVALSLGLFLYIAINKNNSPLLYTILFICIKLVNIFYYRKYCTTILNANLCCNLFPFLSAAGKRFQVILSLCYALCDPILYLGYLSYLPLISCYLVFFTSIHSFPCFSPLKSVCVK